MQLWIRCILPIAGACLVGGFWVVDKGLIIFGCALVGCGVCAMFGPALFFSLRSLSVRRQTLGVRFHRISSSISVAVGRARMRAAMVESLLDAQHEGIVQVNLGNEWETEIRPHAIRLLQEARLLGLPTQGALRHVKVVDSAESIHELAKRLEALGDEANARFSN